MRYGSAADTGVADRPARTSEAIVSERLMGAPPSRADRGFERGELSSDAPLLVAAVHRLQEFAVAIGHESALHLAGRGDRLAFVLWSQLLRKDPDRLDLLDTGQVGVRALHLLFEEAANLGAFDEGRVARVGDALRPRPLGDRVEVQLEQCHQVLSRLAEHGGLADIRARAEPALDVGRAHVL